MTKSVDDFLKDFEKQEESNSEQKTSSKKEKQEHLYRSLVKTDKEYKGHPVYEIELSTGEKILGCKIDNKLVQLRPMERLYKDVVNDSLAGWMTDSATKSRNKWRAEYYKATIRGSK